MKKKPTNSHGSTNQSVNNRQLFTKQKTTQIVSATKFEYQRTYLLLVALLFLGSLVAIPISFVHSYVYRFNSISNTSVSEILTVAFQARNHQPKNTNQRINFLILGLDAIQGERSNSQLTDTIIIASLNLDNSRLNLIPIPRDLWLSDYKTKINSIYYYGEISSETTGDTFISDVITEITGLNMHHVFIINLEILADLIEIIDGVEIEVPAGFVDTQFPRSTNNLQTNDPELIYETVTFNPGVQTMNGDRALKYIRSRQSQDLRLGNDLSRNNRQLLLIQAIVDKISQKQVITNPEVVAKLFNWYEANMTTNSFNLLEAMSIILALNKHMPEIEAKPIPIDETKSTGVLIHPPVDKYGQWVYEPIDEDWSQVRQHIKLSLDSD